MKLSNEGLNQIAQNEGFASKMYPDHKGYSIGYGHLILANELAHYTGMSITEDEAKLLLQGDAAKAETYVNNMIKVQLTQAQFDALVDFTYNMGPLPLEHIAYTLNQGNYKGAGARMMLYNKMRVNSQLVENPGLTARRKQEASVFV